MLLICLLALFWFIYDSYKSRDQKAVTLSLYCVLAAVILILNPLMPRLFSRIAEDDYSFIRFTWLIPFFFFAAFAATRIIRAFDGKKRALASVIIVCAVVLSGEFAPNVYVKAENSYKVTNEIRGICDAILSDAGMDGPLDGSRRVRVLLQLSDNDIYEDGSASNMLYFGIRQYAEPFFLTMCVVDPAEAKSIDSININSGYEYFICDNEPNIIKKAKSVGYTVLSEEYDHVIMKSNVSATLFIIRHAETEANVNEILAGRSTDSQLTDEGIEVAHEMGTGLKGVDLDYIYTSDITRTISTAAAFLYGADQLEKPIEPTGSFRDVSWGELEGQPLSELYARYGSDITLDDVFGASEDMDFVSPVNGTDTMFNYYSYMDNSINSALTESYLRDPDDDDLNIMIVTHSAVSWWLEKNFPEYRPVTVKNASVTVIGIENGRWSVYDMADTDPEHLSDIVRGIKGNNK